MAAASHYDIEGVWIVDTEPLGESCILVIMPDGRTVQFPTSVTKPRVNQTMRLWHSDYDGTRIRFRPSPSAEGWFRGVEPEGNAWVMTAEREGEYSRFRCTSITQEELPDWYEEMLAINLEKMAGIESEDQRA